MSICYIKLKKNNKKIQHKKLSIFTLAVFEHIILFKVKKFKNIT